MKLRPGNHHGSRRRASTSGLAMLGKPWSILWIVSCAITSTLVLVVLIAFCRQHNRSDRVGNTSNPVSKNNSPRWTNYIFHRTGLYNETVIQQHRIAMILPYTAPFDNPASILPYWTTFCVGAAGASDVIDFVVFHTGLLAPPWAIPECPDNVVFVNLQSHANLAKLLLRVVDVDPPLKHQSKKLSPDELLEVITSYIKVNPYGLVEFKPALGHIFQDYLHQNNYTHWGYTDFDVLFGDVSRWITLDELEHYDIVTYSYGDQHRLYLRGQFTLHKNDAVTVNQLWRACDYLTSMGERFQKIVQRDQNYHVESAEGCYSAAIFNRSDLAVKFAVKAWTDIYTNDTAYSHGVFVSRGGRTNDRNRARQVLYKQARFANEQLDGTGTIFAVSNLAPDWFQTKDAVYRDRTIPLQREVGDRVRVEFSDPTDRNGPQNCMYWALPKYQSKLCLPEDAVTNRDTVFWINGELWKQKYENVVLQTLGVVTAPLFHFQEWKRAYQYGQLASMKHSSSTRSFCLTPEGAIPLIENKRSKRGKGRASSPLGLSDMTTWTAVEQDDRSQLPTRTYCVASTVDKHARCDLVISWQDTHRTLLLATARKWNDVESENDVTLALTLQISVSQSTNPRALRNVMDHLKTSLQRWVGLPSVVVISVASTEKASGSAAVDFLKENLQADATDIDLSSSLVAIVAIAGPSDKSDASKKHFSISRKALLNMAVDAVPTRWYLSGVELERGLTISMDAAYFAHRVTASHSRLSGSIFLVPQFGLMDHPSSPQDVETTLGASSSGVISINDMLIALETGRTQPMDYFDDECNEDEAKESSGRLGFVDVEWRERTLAMLNASDGKYGSVVDSAKRAEGLERLQNAILKFAEASMYDLLGEHPITLTDNLGPYEGIRTSEIVREVEMLSGLRCYNGLRMVQLALLGYSFDVLAGAFSLSTDVSRSAAAMGMVDGSSFGCRACSYSSRKDDAVLDKIATNEIKRVAKAAILWSEVAT